MTTYTTTPAEWSAALRSGRFEQGHGMLVEPVADDDAGTFRYCCLGVMAEMVGAPFGSDAAYLPDTVTNTLSAALIRGASVTVNGYVISVDRERHTTVGRLGRAADPLLMRGQDLYAQLNDTYDFTFDQIADVIDAILWSNATITIEA